MEDREQPCECPLKLIRKVICDDELRCEVLKGLGYANKTFSASIHEHSSEGSSDLSENFDNGPEDIGQTLNEGGASAKVLPHLEESVSRVSAGLNNATEPVANRRE